MHELNIPPQLRKKASDLVGKLKDIYQEDLVSLVFYGSAASGEFVDARSNVNLLVVLKSVDLACLRRSSPLLNKYPWIQPLFLTQEYIKNSTDTFPIEFLDMKENYQLAFGADLLKDLAIDLKNLRFQCEQELKAKLITVSQSYLKFHNNKTMLRGLLFKTFISVVHVARNLLRLKNRIPPYRKYDVLKELSAEFGINLGLWEKIMVARKTNERVTSVQLDEMFEGFTSDLEKLAVCVDAM
jgi:hypothetical protein